MSLSSSSISHQWRADKGEETLKNLAVGVNDAALDHGTNDSASNFRANGAVLDHGPIGAASVDDDGRRNSAEDKFLLLPAAAVAAAVARERKSVKT